MRLLAGLFGAMVLWGVLAGCSEVDMQVDAPTPSPSVTASSAPATGTAAAPASDTPAATPTRTPAPDASSNTAPVGTMPRGFSVPLDVSAVDTLDGMALCRASADYPGLGQRVASRFWVTTVGDGDLPVPAGPAVSSGGPGATASDMAAAARVRHIADQGGETVAGGALIVTSEAAARDLMAEIRARAVSCVGTTTPLDGSTVSWALVTLSGEWDQAVVLVAEEQSVPVRGPQAVNGQVIVVAQRRHALSFASRASRDARPIGDPTVATALAEQARVEAERILAQLVGR